MLKDTGTVSEEINAKVEMGRQWNRCPRQLSVYYCLGEWLGPISPQARTDQEDEQTEQLAEGKQSSGKSRRYRFTDKIPGQEMDKGAGGTMV